jgi:hypothetical protein
MILPYMHIMYFDHIDPLHYFFYKVPDSKYFCLCAHMVSVATLSSTILG